MKSGLLVLGICISLCSCRRDINNEIAESKQKTETARKVLHRILGDKSESIQPEMLPAGFESDTYEYSCINGILKVKGTSVPAVTRGVYDYLKDNGLGKPAILMRYGLYRAGLL
jgi:alpha-N-acetylglucosaminidase